MLVGEDELLLARDAHGDEEEVRVGAAYFFGYGGIFGGGKIAVSGPHDVAARVLDPQLVGGFFGDSGGRAEEVDAVALFAAALADVGEDLDAAYSLGKAHAL